MAGGLEGTCWVPTARPSSGCASKTCAPARVKSQETTARARLVQLGLQPCLVDRSVDGSRLPTPTRGPPRWVSVWGLRGLPDSGWREGN